MHITIFLVLIKPSDPFRRCEAHHLIVLNEFLSRIFVIVHTNTQDLTIFFSADSDRNSLFFITPISLSESMQAFGSTFIILTTHQILVVNHLELPTRFIRL